MMGWWKAGTVWMCCVYKFYIYVWNKKAKAYLSKTDLCLKNIVLQITENTNSLQMKCVSLSAIY